MKRQRATTLALDALRLLKQQSSMILENGFETSLGEVLDAINFFDSAASSRFFSESSEPRPGTYPPPSLAIAEQFGRAMAQNITVRTEYVASGHAVDWADYKRVTGEIAGLRAALNLYGEIINESEDDDDNETEHN